MSAFLNCNIWSINDCIMTQDGYTFIKRVYEYNSDTDEFNTPIPPGFIQIPEFEIKNLHLLENVDCGFINKFRIPIIKKDNFGCWTIDLKYYEDTYLQYSTSK